MQAGLTNSNGSAEEARDTMLLFGGVALMMLGAGMVMTSPLVRRYLGGVNLSGLLQSAAPDFERYLKLKAM
jgi:hypothetical protein